MENKVLAKIDEFEITEKDLNDIINRYPEDKRGYFSTEEGKKALLEQTIGFELMNKLGEEIELNKTEEFKTEMENYAKDLLIRMTMNKVLSEVTITENDAEKYYNDNKDMFKEQPTVSAKHILVDSEEKAKEIKEEIDTNKISFEEAAKKYSSCPSKDQGGNLGVFGKGMMVPEFEDIYEAIIGAKSAGMTVCAIYDKYSDYNKDKITKLSDFYIKDFTEIIPKIV